MSVISFGMSFVLKGSQIPKLPNEVLVDGVFQLDLSGKSFHFITKCQIVHSVGFHDLYDARGNMDNKFVILLLFNNNSPLELHAQTEQEREKVFSIFQDILRKSNNISLDDALKNQSVQKQSWVKKKGKVMAAKRLLMLNTTRNSLIIFKAELTSALPSYFILLHNRVVIEARKQKEMQIIGTYKSLWISFPSQVVRDEWLNALNKAKQPLPVFDANSTAPAFDPIVQFSADARGRQYPVSHFAVARAGPSAD